MLGWLGWLLVEITPCIIALRIQERSNFLSNYRSKGWAWKVATAIDGVGLAAEYTKALCNLRV